MSAHTPGPWALKGVMAMDTPVWIVSIPGEPSRIEVADYSHESEGNARLIAAAPVLLDETVKAIELLKALAKSIDGTSTEQRINEVVSILEDAVAQARGGQ